MSFCRDDRVEAANLAIASFAPGTAILIQPSGHVAVRWRSRVHGQGEPPIIERRWMARGQDFYPVWQRLWSGGGTACTALSQLVRWVKGRPVLPISTWRYWASSKCKLLRHGDDPVGHEGEAAISALLRAGYPERVNCVLCGLELGPMDWWSLGGVSGPCCGWASGCRQEVRRDQGSGHAASRR